MLLRDAIKHSKIVSLLPEHGDPGGQAKGQRSDQRACVLQTFRHVQPSRKMADPPAISPVFRHHFWCFPFLYIKNTKHNSEKNSIGFLIFPKLFFFLFIFIETNFFFLFSSSHLHIDKVYNILQLNKTER